MPIADGLYKAQFANVSGQGSGVAHLSGGTITGGDSVMAYIGTYEEEASVVTATVHVFRHSHVPGFLAVSGANDVTLSFSGALAEDGAITLAAPTPAGLMNVALTKIEQSGVEQGEGR